MVSLSHSLQGVSNTCFAVATNALFQRNGAIQQLQAGMVCSLGVKLLSYLAEYLEGGVINENKEPSFSGETAIATGWAAHQLSRYTHMPDLATTVIVSSAVQAGMLYSQKDHQNSTLALNPTNPHDLSFERTKGFVAGLLQNLSDPALLVATSSIAHSYFAGTPIANKLKADWLALIALKLPYFFDVKSKEYKQAYEVAMTGAYTDAVFIGTLIGILSHLKADHRLAFLLADKTVFRLVVLEKAIKVASAYISHH